jgi:hypothetical protein
LELKETFYLFPQELAQNIYVSIKQLELRCGKARNVRREERTGTGLGIPGRATPITKIR